MRTVSYLCPVCKHVHNEAIFGRKTTCMTKPVFFSDDWRAYTPDEEELRARQFAEEHACAWWEGFSIGVAFVVAVIVLCWVAAHVRIYLI